MTRWTDDPITRLRTMPSVNELAGKSVFITGGARRLGRAIALARAQAGARVAFTYLNSGEQAKQTLAEMERRGARGLAISCDAGQEDSVIRAIATAVGTVGAMGLLGDNAGVSRQSRFEEITRE